MPTRDQIEAAVQAHFDAWNAKDRQRWLANFADDIAMEDPYGGPRKEGRSALERSWEHSFKEGQEWKLERVLTQMCADQAAVVDRIQGTVEGSPVTLDSIEIYTVSEQGRICHIRTYFNPPDGQQLDPYFTQVDRSK